MRKILGSKIKYIPLYMVGISTVIVAVLFLYAFFYPVQVLTHWNLHVDTGLQYTPGSTVYLTSTYTKVKNVSGTSKRYLQCHKANSNDWDGYIPLNESDANRPVTKAGTSVTALAVPLDVPNLPNICRVYIHVTYQINPLRIYEQYNYSNSFKVITGTVMPNQNSSAPPDSTIQPQESLAPQGNSNISVIPPVKNIQSPPEIVNQPQTAQSVAENAPATSVQQNPSLLQAVLTPVKTLLNLAGL